MFKKIIDTITDSLRVKNNEIIGNIYNLEKKLNGEIPITRLELLVLVNSWGRKYTLWTKVSNNKEIFIYKCNKSKKPYDLSKLNVSQITNMESIFLTSNFNGDISKWDVSNVTNMGNMFREAHNFNFNIGNWNIGNVENLSYMFYNAESFNQNISKWILENIKNCDFMFDNAKAFLDKYNSGKPLPNHIDKIKKWFNKNSDRINEIDIKNQHGVELDNFFSNIKLNIIEKT